jgi:hypothetical protein
MTSSNNIKEISLPLTTLIKICNIPHSLGLYKGSPELQPTMHQVGLRGSLTALYWFAAAHTLLNGAHAQDVVYGRAAVPNALVEINGVEIKLPPLVDNIIKKISPLVAIDLSLNLFPKLTTTSTTTPTTLQTTTRATLTTTTSGSA